MEISVRHEGHVLVVALSGCLDAAAAPALAARCEPYLQAGHCRLVLDLAGLTYLSSQGVHAIMDLGRRARGLGGELSLCGARGMAREVLDVLHLGEPCPVHSSAAEASRGEAPPVGTMVDMTAPARLAEAAALIDAATAAGRAAGFGPETVRHLELAVEEAVVNVCSYAYPGGEGTIELRIRPARAGLQVDISDRGAPFDPLSVREPDLTQAVMARSVGGLGIFLIRHSADEVSYQRKDGANVLTLVIRDRPATEA
ncbi:MAG: anti-sigma factor antagonist [Armatimonadota bacterium]